MKKIYFILGIVIICLIGIVNAAPVKTTSDQGKRLLSEINEDTDAYDALAIAIRNAKDFKELQTILANWADAQKERSKNKKKPKIK